MSIATPQIKKLHTLHERLERDHKKHTTKIKELEKQGATAGSIVWQEKRPGYHVAYLHHATSESGGYKHVREYIGKDKAKIKEAENRIQRANQINKLRKQIYSIEKALADMARSLNVMISMCTDTANNQRKMW